MGKGIESLCCCVAARGTSGNTSHGQHCNSSARLQLRAGGASRAVQGESPAGLAQASLHDGSDSHHSCPQSHGDAVPCTFCFPAARQEKHRSPLFTAGRGCSCIAGENSNHERKAAQPGSGIPPCSFPEPKENEQAHTTH